jgi:flagellin-specific chaperone FliS
MTCYFKNSRMKELLRDIEVEATTENIKKVDEILHELLSVDYPNCAATWKMVRKKLKYDAAGFTQRLRAVVETRL